MLYMERGNRLEHVMIGGPGLMSKGKTQGFRKRKEFPTDLAWSNYLADELWKALERNNSLIIRLRGLEQKLSGEKTNKGVNGRVGDAMDKDRIQRMNDMRAVHVSNIKAYQDQITEINKQIKCARGINQREELNEKRKTIVRHLEEEQKKSTQCGGRIRKANIPVARYFIDLMRDVLGEEYYEKCWKEAESIREAAIRKGTHENSKINHNG